MTVPIVERTFPAGTPSAASDARRFIDAALEHLSRSTDTGFVPDVLLASNELVTNAGLHARTSFTVRVVTAGDLVRIEVEDEAGDRPAVPIDPRRRLRIVA